MLRHAAKSLRGVLEDERIPSEMPLESQAAVQFAPEAIVAALRQVEPADARGPLPEPIPVGPTRQQGQFQAFIQECTLWNAAGVARTHTALARFFNLTARPCTRCWPS